MVSRKRNAALDKSDEPHPTAFQERLYAACKKIPKGKVTTYGALAKALSSSARAVGQVRTCLAKQCANGAACDGRRCSTDAPRAGHAPQPICANRAVPSRHRVRPGAWRLQRRVGE
eukprot:93608-Chlamydomonas_euryale.AAC.5